VQRAVRAAVVRKSPRSSRTRQARPRPAIPALAKRLGIPAAEIATIGDMPNDVLMFRRSGLSIAMGNASDEVKAQASVVTDSYNNEGFAKAVEQYLLNGSAS
jgi:hydroxymethylpyrimidine pyrophosphatase-like HAD family hydrolase